MDIIITEISKLKSNLTIASEHFSSSTDRNVFRTELNKLINFLKGNHNVLVAGDFNARSNAAGDHYISAKGHALEEVINKSNFRLFSNGKPTFFESLVVPNPKGFAPDITISNSVEEEISKDHHRRDIPKLRV